MTIVVCTSKFVHRSVNHSKMDTLQLMHKHHIKGAGQRRTDIDKSCKDPSIQQSYQQQHRRSESSKEGTAHNIQRVPQSPSCRNTKGHRGLRSTNTAKVKTVLPFRKGATTSWLISKRLKEVAVEEAETRADQITSTDDYLKMFRAAKQLRSNK